MVCRALAQLTVPYLVTGFLHAAESTNASNLRVPEGFAVEKISGPPECVFPMFATFDDPGRLFVAESSGLDLYAELTALTRKCRVRLLEDRDADGYFETSTVFADKLVFPMGLTWHEDELFVADPPDLVVYADRDGDGNSEGRRVLLSGFGHKDNGSLHGLIFGPDGLLYMTMGEPDGFHLKGPDGSTADGATGALIRCRPDGSRLEVVSRGFANLVEVEFTSRGEVIGTDNWFQLPIGGMRDALVHLVDGGFYPLNSDKGGGRLWTGDLLPPVSLYPAVALSGLVRYRGGAFPAEMWGSFFSAQHNARRVGRHHLVRKGSSFESEDQDFVTSEDPDFHPSDVLEDADGSLLIVDTGGWYVQHCPTGKIRDSQAPGGIYRVRWKNTTPIVDPWGSKIDWTRLTNVELLFLLGDARPAVSYRARQILRTRGDTAVPALSALLQAERSTRVKQEALWALAGIETAAATEALRKALANSDADLTLIAARGLGMRGDTNVVELLHARLGSSEAAVQLAAAEALARCGNKASLAFLWQTLTQSTDKFLRHAVVHAAHKLADRPSLEQALKSGSTRVQAVALLLLDQTPHSGAPKSAIMERLSSQDNELAQTALWVLKRHSEWADEAVELVHWALAKRSWTTNDTVGLGGLILAFQSHTRLQQVLADCLAKVEHSTLPDQKLFLIETISRMNLRELPANWIEPFRQLLRSGVEELRRQTLRLVAKWDLQDSPSLAGDIAAIADNQNTSADLRLDALRTVGQRKPELSDARFHFVLEQLTNDQAPLARLTAGEIVGRARLTPQQKLKLLKAVEGRGTVSAGTLVSAFREGDFPGEGSPLLLRNLDDALRSGWHPQEADIEAVLGKIPGSFQGEVNALRKAILQSAEQQRARLRSYEPVLNGGTEEFGRAVFFSTKTGCSACHRIGGLGGAIGPDLTKIGAIRSGRDLLESIILPSSTFAQTYESYALILKDGREADGTIARQDSDVVVLRDASGAEQSFRQEDIVDLRRRATSLMPEGSESAMTQDEFRDLLAFLKSLK